MTNPLFDTESFGGVMVVMRSSSPRRVFLVRARSVTFGKIANPPASVLCVCMSSVPAAMKLCSLAVAYSTGRALESETFTV